MSRYKQGFFKPKNPKKYKGDPTNIIYRSSWELKAFMDFDKRDEVVQWSSEEIVIPYICKTDNRPHRYFTDFWVKIRLPDNSTKEFIGEIKPLGQVQEPKKPKKITKTYVNEVLTYAKNTSKWEAAREYCKKNNIEFQIITEKDLFSK